MSTLIIAGVILVVVYIIILELRLHDIKENRVVNVNRDEHGNVRMITATSGVELHGGVTTTEETVLKDRVSKLEKHYHGLNALEALEKEGIKEGAIIKKACFSSMPGIPCYEYRTFVVTECSHEMLEDDEIMVEDIHHHSEKIDVFCTRLASEKDREEFIHAYNDYADKSKIEIPSEDLHVMKHPDSK